MLFAELRPLIALASWRSALHVLSFGQAPSMCGHALVSIASFRYSLGHPNTPDLEKGELVAPHANKDNA
jgi:hypothetical protein